MRLAYFCHYDGKECNKEIPKLNEIGEVIYPKKLIQIIDIGILVCYVRGITQCAENVMEI